MSIAVTAQPTRAIDSPAAAHYIELDGMRGLLATTIMLFHLGLDRLISALSAGGIHDSL